MDICHYFAICKIMILRPNLVVYKISSSKPSMIARPQLQEEEQQEQVSSAGSFARLFFISHSSSASHVESNLVQSHLFI